MKLVRFLIDNVVYRGRLEADRIIPLDGTGAEQSYSLADVRLLAPVSPTKVVAIGLNYRDHAEEVRLPIPEEPLLFIKPPSSVIGPEEPILMPPQSARVDYEAELAVVIGKQARRVPRDRAAEHILGYTCLNDVTARDLQKRDGQWTRAKGFDTFCPIGPWVETEVDPSDLAIELYLNGERKQASRTSMLIFPVDRLVEFVSSVMTLEPGDIIATGTTSGIGPMKAGDSVEVRIEGIGSLNNPVNTVNA
ncbi:MAG: fumarylacetoacetate hydrolase family protein [Desulfomonile sp.]|nr:fumarylacetoacetate hydrolase family protein [Desulfomonile sp.]